MRIVQTVCTEATAGVGVGATAGARGIEAAAEDGAAAGVAGVGAAAGVGAGLD
jgi:hypothetical protein